MLRTNNLFSVTNLMISYLKLFGVILSAFNIALNCVFMRSIKVWVCKSTYPNLELKMFLIMRWALSYISSLSTFSLGNYDSNNSLILILLNLMWDSSDAFFFFYLDDKHEKCKWLLFLERWHVITMNSQCSFCRRNMAWKLL